VATGTSLAAVDLFAASGQSDIELSWSIHRGGPDGPRIGPQKTTRGSYFASSTDLVGASYNPGDVPLVPGETYYIDIGHSRGITPYLMQPWESYPDGEAYRDGVAIAHDLSMTILEYTSIPEPASLTLLVAAATLSVCNRGWGGGTSRRRRIHRDDSSEAFCSDPWPRCGTAA
jgi:hypothetical protein